MGTAEAQKKQTSSSAVAKPGDIKIFSDFYPFYLREHSKPETKLLHFLGTSGAMMLLLAATRSTRLERLRYLALVPVCGYGFAWISHFFVEKNRPATFFSPKHAWWSLLSDLRLWSEIVRGHHAVLSA
jgi:hypothetical protein